LPAAGALRCSLIDDQPSHNDPIGRNAPNATNREFARCARTAAETTIPGL
jgi:hypothetical protein